MVDRVAERPVAVDGQHPGAPAGLVPVVACRGGGGREVKTRRFFRVTGAGGKACGLIHGENTLHLWCRIGYFRQVGGIYYCHCRFTA